MRNKRGLLAVAVWCAAACNATGAPPAPATMEIGTDDGGYLALANGGTIKAYMGPQGGFHVYLTVRATGIDPGQAGEAPTSCALSGDFTNPCVDFIVTDVDSGRVLDIFSPLRLPLTSENGYLDVVPARLVQLDIRSLDEVDGKRLRLAAKLTDRAGLTVEASSEDTVVAQRPDAGP
jgi:hypothetical protein